MKKPTRSASLFKDGLIALGVIATLFLLAAGQVAATVLIMVPMVFLIFGRRQDKRPDRESRGR
jgi:hypothetical protein